MEAGRELDTLVAEKVMGLNVDRSMMHNGPSYFDPPAYSTDIAAAWLVVEKLRETHDVELRGYQPYEPNNWQVVVDSEFYTEGTAPHAICLAALKAVGADPDAS